MFRYFALYSLACLLCGEAAAQAVHGGVCRPVSERDQEIGCWILSNDPIGEFAGNQVFWHLDNFETREAAEAAKGRRSTVLQAPGKVGCSPSMTRIGTRPAGNISAQSGRCRQPQVPILLNTWRHPSGYFWRPEPRSDYYWRPVPRAFPFFNSY